MPLPPARHPMWLMVSIIACVGAAITSRMGGSSALPIAFAVLAAVFTLLRAIRVKGWRRSLVRSGAGPSKTRAAAAVASALRHLRSVVIAPGNPP
jgi:hypothetical protein